MKQCRLILSYLDLMRLAPLGEFFVHLKSKHSLRLMLFLFLWKIIVSCDQVIMNFVVSCHGRSCRIFSLMLAGQTVFQ